MLQEQTSNKFVRFLKRNWTVLYVVIVFVIGLSLRLIYLFRNPISNPDSYQYMEIAQYIFGKDGSTYVVPREPLFSFLLGLIFLIFPDTILTMGIFTVVLGSLNIIITFYITKKLVKTLSKEKKFENFAIISSLLVCFNPEFIKYDTWAVREPLYTMLLLLLFYTIFLENKKLKKILFSVISFLLVLTKTESTLLLLLIAILVFQSDNLLKETRNPDAEIVNNETSITETKVEINEEKARKRTFLSNLDFNFSFVILGLVVGVGLWLLISFLIFDDPFASSNWMAGIYYDNEFGMMAPEGLSTFDYIFGFHTIWELIFALYNGFFQLISVCYYTIFGRYLFTFFVLTLVLLLFKGDYISIAWIIYPPLALGIFAYFWDIRGYIRILTPYSIIMFILIPYYTYKIFDNFNIAITDKVKITLSKKTFYYLAFSFICVKYLVQTIEAII